MIMKELHGVDNLNYVKEAITFKIMRGAYLDKIEQ